MSVKNGTLGTVLAVEAGGERLTVRLDGAGGAAGAGAGQEGRSAGSPVVTFSLRDYEHVDHGYAATIHKAQGVDGGSGACAGVRAHGPACGLCGADTASGGGVAALVGGGVGRPGRAGADPGS